MELLELIAGNLAMSKASMAKVGKVLHLTSRAIAETPKVLFYPMRHTLLAPSREA